MITVDHYKIAEGIYDMMPQDDKNLVAFGMINITWHDLLEKQLKEKFDRIIADQYDGQTPEEIDATMLELGMTPEAVQKRESFISKTSLEVSKSIYRVASDNGAMVV